MDRIDYRIEELCQELLRKDADTDAALGRALREKLGSELSADGIVFLVDTAKACIVQMDLGGRSNQERNSQMLWNRDWDAMRERLCEALARLRGEKESVK